MNKRSKSVPSFDFLVRKVVKSRFVGLRGRIPRRHIIAVMKLVESTQPNN